MNLIKKIGRFQFTTTGIRVCGMLFLAAGVCGAVIQTNLLGAGNMNSNELLTAMEQNSAVMGSTTLSLMLQALGSSALPIFCFLLMEGCTHTSNFGKYFLRVLGTSLLCQLPYNLVMTGSLLRTAGLNPVFAMVMCLIMLYFFQRFQEKNAGSIMIKILAVLGVFLWVGMLRVEHGHCCVILTALLWALRGKPNLQTFLGIMVLFCCMVFSIYYMIAPIGFLILHFYEGEQGNENRLANYLAYPVILLAGGLITVLM